MAQELKPTSCSLQDSSADSFSEKIQRISRRRRRERGSSGLTVVK